MSVNITIIHYSSTGHNYMLAQEVMKGAEQEGATVRLRKAAELAPESVIASSPPWKENAEKTADVPEASHDDLVWADGFVFGTPSHFGGVASQLKQFIDTTGG